MKNPITIEELNALLDDELTKADALDFYFEYIATGPFTGDYELKSHIQIVKNYNLDKNNLYEGAPLINLKEKLLNNANNIARRKRDEKFEKRKQDPDKTVIVTEGDSWFQYPKYKKLGITLSKEVKDVIDYIIEDERFAVKSLDAAADVIKNMYHKGEYFEAIGEQNPEIFILSGGGNDFFEVFPDMVQEGNGTNIESYLKPNWLIELDVIKTYYKGLLDRVTDKFPDLPLLLHGYDYIMPSPDGKWIGLPMIEKGGLDSDADRKKLIKFIMDKFNQNLMDLSEEYANVHFIDVRGTVPQREEFWHDEIHPNDQGFSLVADKFIAKIGELISNSTNL